MNFSIINEINQAIKNHDMKSLRDCIKDNEDIRIGDDAHLRFATRENNYQAAEELIKAGLSPKTNRSEALLIALENNNCRLVQLFLQNKASIYACKKDRLNDVLPYITKEMKLCLSEFGIVRDQVLSFIN